MTTTSQKPHVPGLFRQIAIGVAWVSAVSMIGQQLTDLGPWYRALRQPEWKPPDWAFGAIWTTVFVLIVAAGVLAWRRANSEDQRRWILGLFAINSLLHMLWSGLFFTAKRPDWAMVELVFLWLSIAAIMALFWKISRPAFLLMVPYIGWVTVAGFLNYANVVLNGPFDRPAVAPTASDKSG